LFNTKLASLQLYYDENKSHVDEMMMMMMMPALYWILILKQKSTDIHVGQLEHFFNAPCLAKNNKYQNIIVFGVSQHGA